jgi:hypothetical protein
MREFNRQRTHEVIPFSTPLFFPSFFRLGRKIHDTSPFDAALQSSGIELSRMMIEAGADVNATVTWVLLLAAACIGVLTPVPLTLFSPTRWLVDGVQVPMPLLGFAFVEEHIEMARVLLVAGADVNMKMTWVLVSCLPERLDCTATIASRYSQFLRAFS